MLNDTHVSSSPFYAPLNAYMLVEGDRGIFSTLTQNVNDNTGPMSSSPKIRPPWREVLQSMSRYITWE